MIEDLCCGAFGSTDEHLPSCLLLNEPDLGCDMYDGVSDPQSQAECSEFGMNEQANRVTNGKFASIMTCGLNCCRLGSAQPDKA